ncbi:MAG: DUF3857 and transglutaminase domain-containing protein [bacterium]
MINYLKKSQVLFSLLLFLQCASANQVIDKLKAQRDDISARKAALLREFERAIEENPSDEVFFLKAEFLFENGSYADCIETLKKLSRADYQVNRLFALSYYYTGSLTEALYHFDMIAEDAAKTADGEVLFYTARTQERKNLFEEALNTYGKILSGKFVSEAAGKISELRKNIPLKLKDLGDEIVKLVKNAPSQDDHPQAGAAVLLEREVFEVFPDSTSVSGVLKVIKIFNDRGKKEFAEVHLSYDSTYEEVKVLQAYTIKEDGTVVEVSGQHIRDVSKYLNFPLYSNARVKIISMPEVAPGSVLAYNVEYRANKLIAGNHVVLRYGLQGGSPYIKQEFTIKFPLNFRPNVKTFRRGFLKKNVKIKPEVKITAGRRIYSWKFTEMPEIIPEDRMPSWCDIVDGFRLSTFSEWLEIYDWWKGMLKDRMDETPGIRKKVDELIKGADTEKEKATRIYHWVASQIRYVAVEYGEAGFRPHKAEEIFTNKYGDCKDQAVLLITMLKRAGVKAYPVLIGTRGVFALEDDFPELVFNHAIACAEIDGKIIFMDPTAETTSFGDLPFSDQGRKVLVFYDDRYEIVQTPSFESSRNRVIKKMRIVLSDDETLSAERNIRTFGVYDHGQRYWLKYTKPVKIKEQLEKKVNSITPQAALKKHEISDVLNMNEPCVLRMEFEGRDYLKKAGNFRLLPQWGGVDTSLVSKEKRKYPVEADFPSEETEIYELVFPEKWSANFIPEEISEDNEWFSYGRKFSVSGNRLGYEEKTVNKGEKVEVSRYPEYRKIILDLNRRTRSQFIFEVHPVGVK